MNFNFMSYSVKKKYVQNFRWKSTVQYDTETRHENKHLELMHKYILLQIHLKEWHTYIHTYIVVNQVVGRSAVLVGI